MQETTQAIAILAQRLARMQKMLVAAVAVGAIATLASVIALVRSGNSGVMTLRHVALDDEADALTRLNVTDTGDVAIADDEGRIRVLLFAHGDAAGLNIYDKDGVIRSANFCDGPKAELSLHNAKGEKRAALWETDGKATLLFAGNDTQPCVMVTAGTQGGRIAVEGGESCGGFGVGPGNEGMGIILTGPDGHPRFSAIAEDTGAYAQFIGRNGSVLAAIGGTVGERGLGVFDDQGRERAGLAFKDGRASVFLKDATGAPRVQLNAAEDAEIAVSDRLGRTLWSEPKLVKK
ncbi:MAG: hypothetical protein ACYS9X_16015 [Planctomycetota bacterium]|jgi:hypothetical protein